MFYKLINTTIMKKIYFLLVTMMVTSLSFGQTEIFNAAGGGAYPSVGWSDVNNVTTNVIDRTSYYLVEAGAPSDIITTDTYDLSSYGSATLTLDVASFGGATNHSQAKIEFSFDGGSTYTQTEISTTTTGSSYIAGGSFALSTITNQVKIRISNNGATTAERGVRLRNIKLVALGTTPSLTISAPADMTVFTSGTTNATISMSTNNFVVDALPGAGGTGDGHIHWTVDTNSAGPIAQPMKYDTNDIMLSVVDGSSYVIEMTLVDNTHTPIVPTVTETVSFSVAYPCDLQLTTITTTCDAQTAGVDTYTTTIDFTGGNTSTYVIDTAANGAVSGDNPNTSATGQIIITGSTEGTNLALTVTGDPMNSSCTIVRNITSPVCVPVACQPVGSIIITEIMKNPVAVDDTLGEYFEVYNTTGASIDMQGWVISDADSDSHTITTSVVVPSMGYAVFGRDAIFAFNGGVTVNYEYSGIFMSNGADEVQIECSGTIIDAVAYTDGAFPDTAGVAMELSTNAYDSGFNNNGANWASATSTFGSGDSGTPGAVNDNSAPLGIAENKIVGFKIFPNPTNGSFITITTANNTPKNVQVYDMLGKKVIDQEVATKLNITALQTGIYIVKVTENNLSATKRLIVK